MNRIVILGAAESGVGAAALAKVKGYDVFVSDSGHIAENRRQVLREYNVDWEEGQHSEDLILSAQEIIKSPGIPEDAPIVRKVREAGIPIISEIEFAGRYTDAKMICITGSNGKTTTTSLIYHIFRKAGYNAGLAGNIGRSLALQIAEGKDYDYYIIELSSFQLDNMYEFRANIAILLILMIVSQYIGKRIESHFIGAVLVGLDSTQIACAIVVYRHHLGNSERKVRIECDGGLLVNIM